MHRKALLGLVISLGISLLFVKQTFAASLSTLSDTISTSRPSAAATIVDSPRQAAGAGQVTIYDDNAVYLASDSATFYADPAGGGETTDNGVIVASMSAANTPSSNERIVYMNGTITHLHHTGDAVVVPITAMHTISFKPNASIPSSGKIIISFPSSNSNDTNLASASANTFMFNQLSTSNAGTYIQTNNASTCTWSVTAGTAGGTPSITCTTNGVIAAGTTVTFLIGCATASGASCTTQQPTLINPMRKQPPGANAGQGVATSQADNWKISVTTQDNNSITLDSGTAVVGTIESVQVQAVIDPTLTFQLIGVADATTVNNAFVTGCPNSTSDVTNSGLGTTATNVNMGTVGTALVITAQKAIVSTNGAGGYSLTATASGQLRDVAQGYAVASSTTPAAITAGTEDFGIHPCGSDVATATTTWNNGGNGTQTSLRSGTGFVGWPSATTSLELANHVGTSNGNTTAIEYAITASSTTPAGFYTSVITYVATPTFN